MSDTRLYVKNTSVGRAGPSTWVGAHATPDGAAYVAPWALSLGLEGKLFGAHFGTVTTPLATPATTAIAAQRPQAWVRVPDGTLIVPLNVEITVETAGATTQGEISIAMTQNDIGNGTSSAGTSGALPMNTAALSASNCTCRQLATGDTTAETNLLELKRFSFAASAVNQVFSWNPGHLGITPVVRGGGTLAIYIGGNAVNFFAQVQWAEVTESDYS